MERKKIESIYIHYDKSALISYIDGTCTRISSEKVIICPNDTNCEIKESSINERRKQSNSKIQNTKTSF